MKFTPYQKLVISLMAFLQFTIILDFMVISPLGAVIMPALHITAAQFGLVVSAYAFSAGLSAILSAGFADSFDRKKLLLFFYSGFVLGTLLCGLATSYEMLLLARIVTGLFGGVIGSVVLAITTDVFDLSLRGRVMGTIQTAFAASQILGIPMGLYLSNHLGWHAPFMMIVFVSSLVGIVIFKGLKPINAHLNLQQAKQKVLIHLWQTLKNPRYHLAYITTAFMALGGYMLMPFGSAFTVANLGIEIEKLPMIYLVSGVASMLIGPLVGRACDAFGKYKVFVFGVTITIIMVLFYTHMGVSPLWLVMLVNVLMFAGIFSRMIPVQALTSALPSPAQRGSFMAVSSSLQQVAGGVASVIAGLIVVVQSDGVIKNFEILGYILVATSLFTVFTMYKIQKLVEAA